jgi:hypothetical protein
LRLRPQPILEDTNFTLPTGAFWFTIDQLEPPLVEATTTDVFASDDEYGSIVINPSLGLAKLRLAPMLPIGATFGSGTEFQLVPPFTV